MRTRALQLGVTASVAAASLFWAVAGVRGQSFVPIYPGGPASLQNIRALGQASLPVPPYLNAPGTLYNNATGIPGYDASTMYGNPYSYYAYDPYGGFLRGAAEVINAQGRFAINQQQAILVREQIKAERITNRRRAFDEYLYERDKMPTLQDDRERTQAQELRRAVNDPPFTEIWSATALNNILAELQKQLSKGVLSTQRVTREALDDDTLKRINVTTTSNSGNIGILKNGGRLNWPLALSGQEFKEERDRLSNLAIDTVKEAEFGNRVDAGTVKQMIDDVDQLQRNLARNVGDLPPSQYIDAKRFLNHFTEALKVLQRPDAANYFNRKYAAKGKTISDLVSYMRDQGLQFAPAVTGDEAAYVALHRAMASYLTGIQPPAPPAQPNENRQQ